jgi:hypothetical protein
MKIYTKYLTLDYHKRINFYTLTIISFNFSFSLLLSLVIFTVGDTAGAARAVGAENPGDSINSGHSPSFHPPDSFDFSCQEPITFGFKGGKASP